MEMRECNKADVMCNQICVRTEECKYSGERKIDDDGSHV